EHLGHRGVGLDQHGHVFDGGFPVDGQVALSELLGDPRTGHVDPEDTSGVTVRVALGDDLHHALGLVDDHRPAVVVKAALLDDDVEARLLGLLLGHAGERGLGPGVHAPRDLGVVDARRVLAEDVLDGDHALHEGDVGQRRRGDAVAHGPHALLAGAAGAVPLDEAAVVHHHAGAVEPELVGVGATADRADDHVDVARLDAHLGGGA